LGQLKRPGQLLIGFALETNNELQNAKGKLIKKNCDLLVLNSLQDAGAGFGHDTNKVSILDRHNNIATFELKSKTEVAKDILRTIIDFK
jgi:phosphopantothenoylcysteine decarboxylase/phosphopantothenate--cysteine ligase